MVSHEPTADQCPFGTGRELRETALSVINGEC